MTARKLNANLLVADIRSGLDDKALMGKYDLSPSQLRIALRKLMETHLITESDLSSSVKPSPIETRNTYPSPTNPQGHDVSNFEALLGKCPHCDMTRRKGETECGHCGIVFSKVEQHGNAAPPTYIAPGQIDPELQTATYHGLIAESFIAEATEAHEKKRKKKLYIIWTAVVLALLPVPFVLLGFGREVMLAYTLATALFVFLYYLVVVYYAAQQSRFLGLLCIGFSPVAILFVILNRNGVFSDKFLPKLWLAVMIPLTVALYLAKYGHYKIFPCG